MSHPVVVLGYPYAVRQWKREHEDDQRTVASLGYPLMGYRLTDDDLVLLEDWEDFVDGNPHGWEWIRGSLMLKFGPQDYETASARLGL